MSDSSQTGGRDRAARNDYHWPASHADKLGLTTAETHAVAIASPRLEGDDRVSAPPQQDAGISELITELINLPAAIRDLARDVRETCALLDRAYQEQTWAQLCDVSNASQDGTYGPTGCYKLVVSAETYTRVGALKLRNLIIGCSVADVVQLFASRTSGSPTNARLITTVRTTANTPTIWSPSEVTVFMGESLFLATVTNATAKFDFSCDYRILRGG